MDRNALLNALMARLKNVEGLESVSRRLKVPPALVPSEQPALFIPDPGVQTAEHRARSLPPVWSMEVTLYLFVYSADRDGPSPMLQTLLDRIEVELQRQAGETVQNDAIHGTSLGGLCWGVQVTGVRSTADLERNVVDQALAMIDLDIMVPG